MSALSYPTSTLHQSQSPSQHATQLTPFFSDPSAGPIRSPRKKARSSIDCLFIPSPSKRRSRTQERNNPVSPGKLGFGRMSLGSPETRTPHRTSSHCYPRRDPRHRLGRRYQASIRAEDDRAVPKKVARPRYRNTFQTQ
ncbi:hypothetical protein A0H81_04905 [Grifola frondosa]|uniref:Uncharacterized protein n=1 Tax=Grifola frondosa TaxID=5627 RepID=A0A1C7MET6_GRIFR|nr:hypothetical protein A0H81_04905 [Grifola frondosa]